jgi:Ala-tRNA(Pro) deacylase
MSEQKTQGCEERVSDALDDLGIDFELQHHPPVFTVAEAKALRTELKGAHLKNLFLCDRKKRRFLMLVALEYKRIDLRELGKRLDVASGLRFANDGHLRDILGVTTGAVSPFALLNDGDGKVEVILDEDILNETWVNAHPLHNAATVTLTSTDLLRFLDAQGCQVHQLSFLDGRDTQ